MSNVIWAGNVLNISFGYTVYPDHFFSAHIRDALDQQLRGYQTSVWPEAHASSQSWNNVVSETHVCHLWRPLLW